MNHEDERFSYFLRCGHFYASLPSFRRRKDTVSPDKSWYMAFSQLQDFRRSGCYFKIDCKCSSKIPLTNNSVKSWLGTCWSTLTHHTSCLNYVGSRRSLFFRFRATKTYSIYEWTISYEVLKKIKNPEMNTGNLRPIFFLIHSSAKAYHCICGRNIYLAKNSGFPIIFLQWFNCWLFIVSYVIGRTFV